MLRQVLEQFEATDGSRSLSQMAQDLGIEQAMLEDMIQYWVRKGRLRATFHAAKCESCGSTEACPLMGDMPRSYELVVDTKRSVPAYQNIVQVEWISS
ncbi:MAG: hypothetical protein GYB68_15410 [Chloroflexi bacterium]|nr:hypothetical protein [Chloroflexota bacterium]